MKISLIIPTYQGENKLDRILQSILNQTHIPDEVIVIVDGSTDHSVDKLAIWQTCLPLRFFVGKNTGRGSSRNIGAQKATGDLLIFLDDDMRLEPEGISQHHLHHLQHNGTIVIGSQIEDFILAKSDFHKYRGYLSRFWEPKAQNQPLTLRDLYLTAAHFSISAHLFYSLHGFDERLKDAEDYDFALRAYQAGIPILYQKDIAGWHYDPSSCQKYILRMKEYKAAHEKLQQLNSYAASLSKYMPEKQPFYKQLVYTLFSNDFFPWLIDRFNIFILLPTRIRYKFYGAIIFAGAGYHRKLKQS